jgi:hypothetical protein
MAKVGSVCAPENSQPVNWFGDATAGTWIQVRTLAFNFIGNRMTGPGGIGIKFEGGTQGANISGNRFDGAIQPLVFSDPLSMGYHYGVSATGNDFIASGLIAASGKFESERFCADKRVTTSCDGGFSYFCSILLLETLRCGPSHCTFPMTHSQL